MKAKEERAEISAKQLEGLGGGGVYEHIAKQFYLYGADEQEIIDAERFSGRCNAISLINYLDAHRAKDKMCFSNGECKDLEDAFNSNDWSKVIQYIYKYKAMEE